MMNALKVKVHGEKVIVQTIGPLRTRKSKDKTKTFWFDDYFM